MTWINEPGTAPFPGACLTCGSNRRPVVNFPVTQPWNGAMLICTECFFAAAMEHAELLNLADRKKSLSEIETRDKKIKIMQESTDEVQYATEQLVGRIKDANVDFVDALNRANGGADSGDPVVKLLTA